eukprot:196443-Alexandrium_andersonii.AAC.1
MLCLCATSAQHAVAKTMRSSAHARNHAKTRARTRARTHLHLHAQTTFSQHGDKHTAAITAGEQSWTL